MHAYFCVATLAVFLVGWLPASVLACLLACLLELRPEGQGICRS